MDAKWYKICLLVMKHLTVLATKNRTRFEKISILPNNVQFFQLDTVISNLG